MASSGKIEYIAPIQRAWSSMIAILFRPFSWGKWFALGFTAWLATLMDGSGGGSSGFNFNTGDGSGLTELQSLKGEAAAAIDGLTALILAVVAVGFLSSWGRIDDGGVADMLQRLMSDCDSIYRYSAYVADTCFL